LNLLLNALLSIFKRPVVFFAISILFGRICKLSVETIDLQLFLSNLNVTFFDQSLLVTYFPFLIFEFTDKFIKFLLKKLILALSIEVIDFYSGDFITNILNFNFLLAYIFISLFSLFE